MCLAQAWVVAPGFLQATAREDGASSLSGGPDRFSGRLSVASVLINVEEQTMAAAHVTGGEEVLGGPGN